MASTRAVSLARVSLVLTIDMVVRARTHAELGLAFAVSLRLTATKQLGIGRYAPYSPRSNALEYKTVIIFETRRFNVSAKPILHVSRP